MDKTPAPDDRRTRDEQLAYYVAQERAVDAAESDGVHARWAVGRGLCAEREANGGKQLPNGRMAEVAAALGKSSTELRYRMQLYEKYPTEAEVAELLATRKSWNAIISTLKREQPKKPAYWQTPGVYWDPTWEDPTRGLFLHRGADPLEDRLAPQRRQVREVIEEVFKGKTEVPEEVVKAAAVAAGQSWLLVQCAAIRISRRDEDGTTIWVAGEDRPGRWGWEHDRERLELGC